ncbi:MAG TPA: response regulator [Opitutaceae bacterium]|nr:response regulator [Opitutaceae bacterium]
MSASSQRPIILLVEDSEDDVFFFSRALRESGFDCELVHQPDGSAAIDYLERSLQAAASIHRPDLVFLDLKLPTFTGFEVLSWIRDAEFSPPLDVAILSGSEHAGDVERALSLGASGYYVKPILAQQLKARFGSWHEKQTGRHLPARTGVPAAAERTE